MQAKVRTRELRAYNLSPVEAAVLATISAMNGKANPSSISRRLLREDHSISELLIRMEKKGLIIKTPDAERKSVVDITLTPKGEDVSQKSTSIKSITEMLSCLSDSECQQLAASLKKITRKAVGMLGMQVDWPGLFVDK